MKDIEITKPILKGNDLGIVDKWGIQILKNVYDSITLLVSDNSLSINEIKTFYEYSLSDAIGYEHTNDIFQGTVFLKVKKDGLWGLANLKGELIVPIDYFSIKISATSENINFILTKQNGTEIKIDQNGKPTE